MKRIRLERLSGQLLAANPTRPASSPLRACRISRSSPHLYTSYSSQTRCQSTAAAPSITYEIHSKPSEPQTVLTPKERQRLPLPSPHPSRAQYSAKLAALHARLSLSPKIPLETLARALVDPSADAHPQFNNANLAYVGSAIINYHVSEYLITRYPRLPLAILFAAMKGYAGEKSLHQTARAWGVEAAAAPGEEVDPGLLQFDVEKATVVLTKWGYIRAESTAIVQDNWRRGMSSRVIYDDAFGEMQGDLGQGKADSEASPEVSNKRNTKDYLVQDAPKNAHANFVRAVIGAIHVHCGRDAAKSFIKGHVLSRHLDLSKLFEFKVPTRELARLCAREDFDAPLARLESETGRMSRTPVFVVGIYSGRDKLGEGAGPSLDSARIMAAINALKSWYLYSPGDVPLPSDTFAEDAKPWKPVYVDIGEVIS